MEKKERFEQNTGAGQGNIHEGINQGKNKDGKPGSILEKEADKVPENEEVQQGENPSATDRTKGIP